MKTAEHKASDMRDQLRGIVVIKRLLDVNNEELMDTYGFFLILLSHDVGISSHPILFYFIFF